MSNAYPLIWLLTVCTFIVMLDHSLRL